MKYFKVTLMYNIIVISIPLTILETLPAKPKSGFKNQKSLRARMYCTLPFEYLEIRFNCYTNHF